MKYIIIPIFILAASLPSYAETESPSKEVACRACHGSGGTAPIAQNYPKINGQNKIYLIHSLRAYRAGERKVGLAAIIAA